MTAGAEPADPDLEQLLAVLDDLNLGLDDDDLHNFDAQSPRQPHISSSARIPDHDRLYQYSSPRVPTESGYTPHWELAAHRTQEIPGASPKRVTPKKKNNSPWPRAFAVFAGTRPGVYCSWNEIEPLVQGISGNIYQGYPSFDAATAAFEYARERSWTRVCPRHRSSPSAAAPTPVAIPYLPAPMDSLDTPNPLHGPENAGQKRSYHIVYCGITPGVYQSYLECVLNTLSIRGAVFDSCGSKQLAVQRFEDAVSGGRIKVVTPVYYP
ncbi:hypothetical protein B0H13DRAFT_2361769 [Mycena leptocephala]|nr:hypothetical protein B0H13DRAFT_2361769 [Mycena leptocephala]